MRTAVVDLVERLGARPGPVLHMLGGPPDQWETLLGEIEATADAGAALGLLPIALSFRGVFRDEVVGVLDRLVRACPPSGLIGLEAEARDQDSAWRHSAWTLSPEVRPGRLASIAEHAAALGVASLHRSGFVREAAVHLLAASPDPLALPFLLLRANDWVAEVSGPAIRAIEDHLSSRGAAAFLPSLDLVYRLAQLRRRDLRAVVARVEAELVTPAGSPALQQACASARGPVRRRCLELALGAGTIDVRPVLLGALDDRDPTTRNFAARSMGVAFAGEELRAVVARLRGSRFPGVRQAALALVASHLGEDLRPVAGELLLDANAGVREVARWHLRDAGMDIPGHYRGALADARERAAAAILGLAETGSAADAGLVEPFLLDARPRVRAAAVSALGRLAPDAHRSDLIALLADPSPRVARTACDILQRQPPVALPILLESALGGGPTERRSAVSLIARHDHWTAGLAWLRIAREGDGETARRARMALRRWGLRYNHVFTPPAREQVEAYQRETAAATWDTPFGGWLRDLAGAMDQRLG